ncbi:hypothetical protein [Liquorilactobacillus sicerae]|uniref:hypothetical protein n=1 Tax=Liquorilactobacillus sicerae TaxID=1416943 RepID=UPI002480D59C|nr:hypothetical protein [Liquorilactobacillus sicerae]
MIEYKHIFEPIVINGMQLKNRIIIPPMGSNFANYDGTINNDILSIMNNVQKVVLL